VNSWTNHFSKIWKNQSSCFSTENTRLINSKVITVTLLLGHINNDVDYQSLNKNSLIWKYLAVDWWW